MDLERELVFWFGIVLVLIGLALTIITGEAIYWVAYGPTGGILSWTVLVSGRIIMLRRLL